MLPLTRNTSYTAGAPINSVDLNDLQDCVVGGKHGSSPQYIPPAAFQIETAAGIALGIGQWVGIGIVVASIPGVAPGDVIDRIDWCYNRAGAGTLTRLIKARDVGLTGATILNAWNPGGIVAGAAWAVQSDTPAYTVPAGYGAWLSWQQDTAGHIFGGAFVWTSRP